jgi:hypothetical protein
VELFSAWNLILQVASKCPSRGILVDGDGPITPSDLALKTNFPESIFTLAYEFFSSGGKLAWLEPIDGRSRENLPAPSEEPGDVGRFGENLPDVEFGEESQSPGESPGISRDFPSEGKGRELNGREERDARAGEGRRVMGGPDDIERPRATQADHDRALEVARLYPDKAPKDGRPISFTPYTLNLLATRIAKHRAYPWEDHAKLMRMVPTPQDGRNWVEEMPNPIGLEKLRKAAATVVLERQRL